MSRLKLAESPKRSLEIERPDGVVITLTLRRILKKNTKSFESEIKESEKRLKLGKISSDEFYDEQLAMIVENYNSEDLADIEVDHMRLIADEIKKLSQAKPEAEKKSQE